jgi:hypothetical protein
MEPNTVAILIACIGILPGSIALYIAIRKLPAETRAIESEITLRYQTMLTDAQDRISVLEKGRMSDRSEFDLKIRILEGEIEKQTLRGDRFERWAKNLCGQLRSAKIEPIVME